MGFHPAKITCSLYFILIFIQLSTKESHHLSFHLEEGVIDLKKKKCFFFWKSSTLTVWVCAKRLTLDLANWANKLFLLPLERTFHSWWSETRWTDTVYISNLCIFLYGHINFGFSPDRIVNLYSENVSVHRSCPYVKNNEVICETVYQLNGEKRITGGQSKPGEASLKWENDSKEHYLWQRSNSLKWWNAVYLMCCSLLFHHQLEGAEAATSRHSWARNTVKLKLVCVLRKKNAEIQIL